MGRSPQSRRTPPQEYTDLELIMEYRRLTEQLGRSPGEADFRRHSTCTLGTIRKRFSSLEQIRRRVHMTENCLELYGRPSPLPNKPRLPWDVDWLSREWKQVRIGFAMYASDIRNDLIQQGLNAAVNWSVPPTPSTPLLESPANRNPPPTRQLPPTRNPPRRQPGCSLATPHPHQSPAMAMVGTLATGTTNPLTPP